MIQLIKTLIDCFGSAGKARRASREALSKAVAEAYESRTVFAWRDPTEEEAAALGLVTSKPATDVAGLIPDRAKSGRWERFHLFSPYAKLPTREFGGLHCWEPPLAGICPECDLKGQAHGQSYAMFGSDGTRKCTFCGVTTKVHGSRLYWWFENEVVEASQWTGEKT